MKSFYEQERDDEACLHVQKNTPHEFPAHFHASLEIFILKKGGYVVTYNGEKQTIGDNCIAVIDSFQIHGYERTQEVGQDCVLVIPYHYLQHFNAFKNGRKIESVFLQDATLCEQLLSIVDAYLPPSFSENVRKAGVELLLALLVEKLQFSKEKQKGEERLVRELLTFMHVHFQEKISRETLAKTFGYAPEHISRVFHRFVGKTLGEYINGLRLDYIEEKRAQGDRRTEWELFYEAGFQSQQTYYRYKAKRKREK